MIVNIIKDSFIGALKKSIRPKNLFMFLIISLVVWYGLYYMAVDYIYFYISEAFSQPPTGLKENLKTLYLAPASIAVSLLSLVFTTTVIKNTKEEKFYKNLVFSIRNLPKLSVLVIIVGLIIFSFTSLFNWVFNSQLKNAEVLERKHMSGDLWETIPSFMLLDGTGSETYPILFLLMPSNLISNIGVLILSFIFFFLLQEAILAKKGIKASLIGTVKMFKRNYLIIPITYIVFSLVNLILIYPLGLIIGQFPISFQNMYIFILIFLIVLSWSSLFQIIMTTEVYLRIKKS